MTYILKILFICAFLTKQPIFHTDSVCIPVEIRGGGTIRIEPLNPRDAGEYEREIKVTDNERADARFTFEKEGTFTYSMYEKETSDPKAQKDPSVYILKIVCASGGRVEEVLLYENGNNEKSGRALWVNRPEMFSPDTGDSSMAAAYAISSFISLIIAAVLFRCTKGEDDEV